MRFWVKVCLCISFGALQWVHAAGVEECESIAGDAARLRCMKKIQRKPLGAQSSVQPATSLLQSGHRDHEAQKQKVAQQNSVQRVGAQAPNPTSRLQNDLSFGNKKINLSPNLPARLQAKGEIAARKRSEQLLEASPGRLQASEEAMRLKPLEFFDPDSVKEPSANARPEEKKEASKNSLSSTLPSKERAVVNEMQQSGRLSSAKQKGSTSKATLHTAIESHSAKTQVSVVKVGNEISRESVQMALPSMDAPVIAYED